MTWDLVEGIEVLEAMAMAFETSRPVGAYLCAEEVVLMWGDGYWRPYLLDLLYESSSTATMHLATERLEELADLPHPTAALAALHLAIAVDEMTDWVDDLDDEGIWLLSRVPSLCLPSTAPSGRDLEAPRHDVDALISRVHALETELEQQAVELRAARRVAQSYHETANSHRRAGSTWTDQDVRDLLQMYTDGETLVCLSQHLGRPQRAIKARLAKVLDLAHADDAFDEDGFPVFDAFDVPLDLVGHADETEDWSQEP